MTYAVQAGREDPTVDVLVQDAATGAPQRLTILSGVVAVAPQRQAGLQMYVRGQQPEGSPVGFYVAGCPPLPGLGDIHAHAEASLSQVVVNARVDNVEVAYGIGDVAVQLVASPEHGTRFPYLTFHCYGNQPLGVRYRVTLIQPA
jgi:hypothetical protein